MITVKDRDTTILFDGEELAHSSSYTPGKGRWIEFRLYRTTDNRYVVSRLGATLYYHSAFCDTVRRNYIDPLPSNVISKNMIPCDKCRPTLSEEFVYPEVPRHWTNVSSTPDGVLNTLMKEDEFGSLYLTNVARDLIVAATKYDDALYDAYHVQHLT